MAPHAAAVRQAMADLEAGGVVDGALTRALEAIAGEAANVAADVAHQALAGDGPITADALFGISDELWRTGVAWNMVNCIKSYNEALCPDYSASYRTSPPGFGGQAHTNPFTVYTPLECDWMLDEGRLDADVRAMTDVHTAYAVGRALWLGDGLPNLVDQPTLRRNAQNVSLGGSATDNLDEVFGALIGAYETCTGGSGGATIHLPSQVVPAAVGGHITQNLLWREGDLYRGPAGTIVSPGPGYPFGASTQGANGYGPAVSEGVYRGNGTDEAWVYITGPVEYAVGPVTVGPPDREERFDTFRTNRYRVWGSRRAIVRYDPCCVFAALVRNTAAEIS